MLSKWIEEGLHEGHNLISCYLNIFYYFPIFFVISPGKINWNRHFFVFQFKKLCLLKILRCSYWIIISHQIIVEFRYINTVKNIRYNERSVDFNSVYYIIIYNQKVKMFMVIHYCWYYKYFCTKVVIYTHKNTLWGHVCVRGLCVFGGVVRFIMIFIFVYSKVTGNAV